MSRRQTNSRKSLKGSEGSEQSSRKSRNNRKLSTDSPKKSPIIRNNCSPICSKDSHNLSEYYPSRKRSQSSPRIQLSLDLNKSKFTRIKSPTNQRFRKRLLADNNPITYGEFEWSSSQRTSQESGVSPPKPKVKPQISTNKHKEEEKSSIDFKNFLTNFDIFVTQEVADKDSEVNDNNNMREEIDNSIEMSPSLNGSESETSETSRFIGSPIPSTSRAYINPLSNESRAKRNESISKPQEMVKRVNEIQNESKPLNQKQNDSFDDDFEDSLDGILSQITFPVEDEFKSSAKSPSKNDNKEFEDDDGFESDGDFERMLTQIPNEKLIITDNSDSALDTSIRNMSSSSLSSSGLITLSQIIDLINSD